MLLIDRDFHKIWEDYSITSYLFSKGKSTFQMVQADDLWLLNIGAALKKTNVFGNTWASHSRNNFYCTLENLCI